MGSLSPEILSIVFIGITELFAAEILLARDGFILYFVFESREVFKLI